MILKKINLINFKNYKEQALTFCKGINCFTGKNGSGKTNLLDSIHYLCLSKSAFVHSDQFLICHEEHFFVVEGIFNKPDKDFHIHFSLKERGKKILKNNGYQYEKSSEHVGKFPVVLIAPNDTDLVREGSEIRRKFFDNILSQFDQEYLSSLIKYNQLMKHRNALLKNASTRGIDNTLLESFDLQITPLGDRIYAKRKQLVAQYLTLFNELYKEISNDSESVNLKHQSQLDQNSFENLLKQSYDRDLLTQRSNCGIHKDDFIFELNDLNLKRYGSQGQQKSFVIALQLTKYFILKENTKIKPLLLLDDLFDKLDEQRVGKLLKMIDREDFEQVFITDTNNTRCKDIMSKLTKEFRIFEVNEGMASA